MAETENSDVAEQVTTEENEYIRDLILDSEEMKKIFVGGIPTDSKDEDLKAFFEQFTGGKVIDHVIIRKDSDKKSHFGFVTLESSELVDEVLFKRKDLKFKDRVLDVNRAVPKNNTSPGAHDKTKKLFIANLPKFNCSEEELLKYFEGRHEPKYGTIESVQLIKKKDDQGNKMEENKGFGFVMVSSEDMADKMAIQHATFEFGGRRIELKKSVPTSEGGGRGGGGRGRGRGGPPSGNMYGNYSGAGYEGGYGGAGYYESAWDPYAYAPGQGYEFYGGYGAAGYGAGRARGRYRPY